MSKIGKKAIVIPAGVEVAIDGQVITVKGSKGTLNWTAPEGVKVSQENGEIKTIIEDDSKKNLRGLSRTLINNMVI